MLTIFCNGDDYFDDRRIDDDHNVTDKLKADSSRNANDDDVDDNDHGVDIYNANINALWT